jgi:hypothetical protein
VPGALEGSLGKRCDGHDYNLMYHTKSKLVFTDLFLERLLHKVLKQWENYFILVIIARTTMGHV